MKQKTISKEISIEGKGLHYGEIARLTIKPAPCDSGYVFIRTDIIPNKIVEAIAENVRDTTRCTTISKNNVSISTIEHLLAATFALGIDNVIFEINNIEVPILDGNAQSFIDLYKKTEIVEQEKELKIIDLEEEIKFSENNIEINIFPSKIFEIEATLDFKGDIIPPQTAIFNNFNDFEKEIAKSRTFVLLSDIVMLLQHGLIKGGDVKNAIVLIDREFSQEEFDNLSEKLNISKFPIQKPGEIFNNTPLYYQNEQVRHKILDLIGDLALVGFRFNAKIEAFRNGHTSNTAVAKIIRELILNKYINL